MKKELLEEIKIFLEYLGRKVNKIEDRKETEIIKKFGKEKFDKVFNICFEERLCAREVIHEENKKYFRDKLTIHGLKYLEEYNKNIIIQEHNKTTLFLTTILVLTTIISIFIQLNLTSNITILLIYFILVIISVIIFKKNKIIKI